MIHQALVISAFSARDSILPQEITSSGNPMPRKLSVDSATIAERTFITTINMIDDTKFGARCFHKMCQKLPPMHFAAITYSLLRSCRTSVRIIFAIPNQLVSPMTMDIKPIVAFPIMACRKIISSRFGMLKIISVKRISNVSTFSPAIPLIAP